MYNKKDGNKIIAVNMDETLTNTLESLVVWHNDTYHTHLSVTDFDTDQLWKIWGGTQEETNLKLRAFYQSNYFDHIRPTNDIALESLKALKKRHFTLVIITSRQQFMANKTKKFIDKHYPGIFDSIYFCNLNLTPNEQLEYISKPKSLICREIGVDVLIDVSPKHLLDCSKLGIETLLYDKHNLYPSTEDWIRLSSWKQIIAHFPKPSSPLKHYFTADDTIEHHPQFTYETVLVDPLSDDDDFYVREQTAWV